MKKYIIGATLIGVMIFGAVGCADISKSVDAQQAIQTEAIMNQANSEIGMPNIVNFYEKKTLKEIYELRDDAKLITYTYTTAMNGKKVFQFQSIGYGIPMSVQYSNPEVYKGMIAKSVTDSNVPSVSYGTIPQPEPNGLFMPEGLSSTWIMRVNDNGSKEPVYMEECITVSQTKLPRRLCEEWSLPSNY